MMTDELTRLQAENIQLKKELREITEAINDPAVNLTMTANECVKKVYAEIERMKGQQEPIAWINTNGAVNSMKQAERDSLHGQAMTKLTDMIREAQKHSAPPDLAAKVAELQEKLIEAEDGAGYHAQWSREFKSQLDAAKGRISELTEQVKVAREALNVLKHSTPIEGEYGRALQKTISESLAKLQGIE